MKIEVYQDRVSKPVQEVVHDPGISNAGAVAAVAGGVANVATSIGDAVQQIQRKSETDAAINGAAGDVSDYFAEMRENPIFPGSDDVDDLGRPRDVMALRAEAWDAKKKEIEEKNFGSINHERARDDVSSWWDQTSLKVGSEIENAAITESLQYHGKLRTSMVNTHIQERDMESAYSDVEYGLQNGFWDRAGADDLYSAIDAGILWLNTEDAVYGAFNEAGGSYDGLDAAYAEINASGLADDEKKKMETEVEDYEGDQYKIQHRRESDILGGAVEELHKGIMEGTVTKQMILDDERLDFPWNKARDRDWLIREYDDANDPDDATDWSLVPTGLKSLWMDRYTSDKKWKESINNAFGAGDISYDTKDFLEKLKRDGIMETNVDQQFSSVESFWDGLIKEAEGPEETARLEGVKVEIMDNLHNTLFNNRSDMNDERVQEAVRKSMVTYFAEELEMKRAGGLQNFLDPLLLDDHEKILQAWQTGEYNDTQGLGFVRDTMRQVEKISTDILGTYGISEVTPVPYKNGLEFEGSGPDGEPGYYRLFVKDGTKEDVLQQGYRNNDGEIVWLDSELAQKSPRDPGAPLKPGLPDEATPPETFEDAVGEADQKNQWANEWRDFNKAHGLGTDPTQINRQAETGPPPEGWRDEMNTGTYPEEYMIYPESEARIMARDQRTSGTCFAPM